jgi:hypothetical protein
MPSSTHTEKRYAVCVGINTYADTAALAPLHAAEENATQFDQVLHDLGFPVENRCLLRGSQATVDAINEALDEFILDRPEPNDLVVFYFAGHGVPINIAPDAEDPQSEVFLAPFDFDRLSVQKPSVRKHRAFGMERLRTTYFAGTGARKRLFILDSCHSGDFYGPDYRSGESPDRVQNYILRMLDSSSTGRVALSSCLPYQKARDDRSMTTYIVPALRGAEPAACRPDGCITIGSLFEYLADVMPDDQRPVLSGVQHDTFTLVCHKELASTSSESSSEPSRIADRDTYLTHLSNAHKMLQLPDGREVELERIYVSLKADRMNAAERQAEHDFYLEDVEALWQLAGIAPTDQHAALDAMCKVIARHPRMRMLQARSWQQLFGEPEQRILSLAEVVQRHQAVVLLGDPGSGKTTLGRWLVLQYTGALQRDDERVTVRADHVRPGADAERIDLDHTRLPIPVRIADYARTRWGKEPSPDLSLERFVERGLYHRAESLPAGMNPAQVGALAQAALEQGQALVVLDGLDEVGDLRQRQAVMHAIQDAIQSWRAQHPDGNRMVLTSRIVGYQFHPLTHLPHYTVEDMDNTAITAFCHAWMQHVAETDPDATDAQAQQLANAIIKQTQPGVRVLAGNPLLLTILAQVYWQSSERALPTRRVDLFDAAANALYDQRERFWDNAGIPRLRLYRALAAVAAYLHADEVTGFAEEGSIRAQLATVLDNSEQVEAVLEAAREVSGFLVERGGGVYGFLHRALQEFFAARYLVDEDVPPAERLERLRTRLLDPIWREPLVLAVGWVSRRRYPDSRRLLPQVFDALLDTPDPSGAVLPRRELLAAAACAECERVSPGVGQRIAARMLSFAARREEREVAQELQQRIRQVLTGLRSSPVEDDEIDAGVAEVIQSPDFEQRYAAIDLVIELEWDAPIIVQALLTTWQTYPDPAASLLMVLEWLHERHPDWFTPALLPFRQAMQQQPALWQHIQGNKQWQQVIRLLYLAPIADLEPDQIVRDSPLTPQLLAALHQTDQQSVLTALCDDLLSAASQQGSATARDAALLLSAVGDMRWVKPSVAQVDAGDTTLRPVVATLEILLHQTQDIIQFRDHARALDRDLNYALASTEKFVLARTRARRIIQSSEPAQILADLQNLDQDLILNIDHSLTRANAYDYELAIDLAHVLIDNLSFSDTYINDLIRDFISYLTISLVSTRTYGQPGNFAKVHEIELVIDNAYLTEDDAPDTLKALEWAKRILQDIRLLLVAASPSGTTLQALQQVYEQQVYEQQVYEQQETPDLETEHVSERDILRTSDLQDLAIALTDSNDLERERVRKELGSYRFANQLNHRLIEDIAEKYLQYQGYYQVDTWFDLSLKSIKHDRADWLRTWMQQSISNESQVSRYDHADSNNDVARTILGKMHHITYEAFQVLLEYLPPVDKHSPADMKPPNDRNTVHALLESLTWLARLDNIPEELSGIALYQISSVSVTEVDTTSRYALIKILGHWHSDPASACRTLLKWLDTSTGAPAETAILYEALARCAVRALDLHNEVSAILITACPLPEATAALVRLLLAKAQYDNPLEERYPDEKTSKQYRQKVAVALLELLTDPLPEPLPGLTALLDAGVDDDFWDDDYHDVLARAVQQQVQASEDTEQTALVTLVRRLQTALAEQGWEARRIALAAVAACAEVMPTAVQRAAQKVPGCNLEALLIKGATDIQDCDSRRFAITALSHLRTVTPAIMPALLSGCQDVEVVQRDTIAAAGRFQFIEGDLLPDLVPALTGESVSTAYAVAQLLGALGASAAGEAAGLRDEIITALVDALAHEGSQREVVLFRQDGEEETKGKLADTLYAELLRVAGWPT